MQLLLAGGSNPFVHKIEKIEKKCVTEEIRALLARGMRVGFS